MSANRVRVLAIACFSVLAGCTFHPAGESFERRAAVRAGRPFVRPVDSRETPPLPEHPTGDELVHYSLNTSAEVEQRYWEWRSAIEQIPQDGTPETTLALNAASSITRGRTGAADTVLTAQNMPSAMIPWPAKTSLAARRALENARAAGLRFRRAQFEVRGKVLAAWYDFALTGELIRLEQANAGLLQMMLIVVEARNRAGAAGQAELLKSRNDLDLSRNELASLESRIPAQRAAVNALLSRPPDAPLLPAVEPPAMRTPPYTDDQILALAARQNPELAALARDIQARNDAIERARLEYYPDFAVSISSDLAGITQQLAGMVTVPLLRYQAIDAAVAQAEAGLRAAQAIRRQTGHDLAAQVVMDMAFIRDVDRQLKLFEQTILPRADQTVTLSRASYEAGRSTLLDLLDSQRSLIGIRRLVADLRAARDKRRADLQTITADNLE